MNMFVCSSVAVEFEFLNDGVGDKVLGRREGEAVNDGQHTEGEGGLQGRPCESICDLFPLRRIAREAVEAGDGEESSPLEFPKFPLRLLGFDVERRSRRPEFELGWVFSHRGARVFGFGSI